MLGVQYYAVLNSKVRLLRRLLVQKSRIEKCGHGQWITPSYNVNKNIFVLIGNLLSYRLRFLWLFDLCELLRLATDMPNVKYG